MLPSLTLQLTLVFASSVPCLHPGCVSMLLIVGCGSYMMQKGEQASASATTAAACFINTNHLHCWSYWTFSSTGPAALAYFYVLLQKFKADNGGFYGLQQK